MNLVSTESILTDDDQKRETITDLQLDLMKAQKIGR